jgi:hypothetical protein
MLNLIRSKAKAGRRDRPGSPGCLWPLEFWSRKAKREDCGGAYESGDEKIPAWYEAVFMLRRLYLRDKVGFLAGNDGMCPAHMRSERKPAGDHGHGAKHRQDSNERGHLVCCEANLPSLCSSSVQLGKCCSLSFDRVDFNGLYFDAHFFEPGDGLLDFFSLPIEFNRDDADLLGNARLPEVRHDGKLFSELVDYRARDKAGRIHQPETGDLLGHAGSIDAEKRARRKKCVLTSRQGAKCDMAFFRAWLGHFDPCFTAQTIDAEADLAPDLAGVGSPDIEPVVEMEI